MTKPYRPANSSEGEIFQSEWCSRCQCDAEDIEEEDGCPILADAMAFDIKDEDFPKQWVEDESGPRCTAFLERTGGERADPFAVEKKRAAYDQLERDPATGRPLIP